MPWDTNLKRKRKINLKPMNSPKDPREVTSLEVSNRITEYSMGLMKVIETMPMFRGHSDLIRRPSKASIEMRRSKATTLVSKEQI